MSKKAYFFIDDVIWVFRDIARQKPASIFDNAFMKGLKEAHDKYGLKVQLNVFYRTDFFYGYDEFSLAEMPDCYKDEWQANSDWIIFGFHSKQEFPDYPFVNADYDDVKRCYEDIDRELKRFAGDGMLSKVVCPHWLPVSKEGCQALYDCGIRLMSPTYGEKGEYDGDPNSLPYSHAFRLMQNKKPETGTFTRGGLNAAISRSICGHNHVSQEEFDKMLDVNDYVVDKETGMKFKRLGFGPTLNLVDSVEEVTSRVEKAAVRDYYGCATHEQYFYEDYYAYQPNYMAKLHAMAKVVSDKGYNFIFLDEIL